MTKIGGIVAINALRCTPAWEDWMLLWVAWDYEKQEYYGACPDGDDMARHHTPSIFVQQFSEASAAWAKQNES